MSGEPQWIVEESALQIHELQLQLHGGLAGVRDAGLLSSALHRPKNLYSGEASDLSALATSYAAGIARNHPFLDGNKRTAAVVCELFIRVNGATLTVNSDDWYVAMIALASSQWSEKQFAQWLREHMTPQPA